MKTFIFANAYTAKTLLMGINYLFSMQITSVLLLRENHHQDNFQNNKAPNVVVYDNIYECVINCDMVLVLEDDFIPQKSIDQIRALATSHNKRFLKIQNPFTTFNSKTQQFCKARLNYAQRPVVFCLSISPASQYLYIELLLNNIFKRRKIAIRQIFSDEAYSFLNQIKSTGYLHNYIATSLSPNTSDNYEVIVETLNIYMPSLLNNYLEHIRNIHPDFTILLSDEKLNEYSLIKDVMKYGAATNLDLTITSNYLFTYGNQRILYFNKSNGLEVDCTNIESKDLGEEIMRRIIFKIAMPDSITEI